MAALSLLGRCGSSFLHFSTASMQAQKQPPCLRLSARRLQPDCHSMSATKVSLQKTSSTDSVPLITVNLSSCASSFHSGRGLLRFHGCNMRESAGVPRRYASVKRTTEQSCEKGKATFKGARAANEGVVSLAVAVGIPLVAGIIDALVNSPGTQWFKNLKKPSWEPPDFLFGAAWSVLYPLMGLASWLVWAEGGWQKQALPLTVYAVQLVLNLLWPALFFGAQNLGLALVDIVLLLVAIVVTIVYFQRVNPVAANLLKPYLAWVVFATALNYNLWANNRGSSSSSQPLPQT